MPEFTITYPSEQPLADVWGRLNPESVSSVVASDTSLWLCSRIARENLSLLTHLPLYLGVARVDQDEISQHDAVWLIQQGKNILEEVSCR